jgi:hypothetical protein
MLKTEYIDDVTTYVTKRLQRTLKDVLDAQLFSSMFDLLKILNNRSRVRKTERTVYFIELFYGITGLDLSANRARSHSKVPYDVVGTADKLHSSVPLNNRVRSEIF